MDIILIYLLLFLAGMGVGFIIKIFEKHRRN